jgi:4-amino-4-deoxy-L-arabinose transferase-like glycosyltransferase
VKAAQFSGEQNLLHLKTVLKNSLPLSGILLGFILMSVATGQFSNYDSQVEYSAALGVTEYKMPYFNSDLDFSLPFGVIEHKLPYDNYTLINQPPLGFYTGALFLRAFGSSYAVAVAAPTLFGAGCIILLYQLGKVLYDRRTGLFAAAVFASTPWHIVLSRSFLIDAECLFFSLLYLLVGIYATKRNSSKLTLLSGVFFGVAFLTKAFAVFMLVPLALYYLFAGPKNLKRILMGAIYFVPALIFTYVWYELITNRGFYAAFTHDDFNFHIPDAAPSPFFLLYYLLGTVGVFFLAAGAVSLLVSFVRRKSLGKVFGSDLLCLTAVATVLGVNIYLVLGRNLICPYNNPIKYDYQFLPLFCLLAASLLNKLYSFDLPKLGGKRGKLVFLVTLVGLVLIVASIVQNVLVLNGYATQTGVLFSVEKGMGYSFEHIALNGGASIAWALQWLGFAAVAFSLVWANRDKLKTLAATLQQL